MTGYRLTEKPTKDERREHVTRIKGMARDIASKMDKGTSLEEQERRFADYVLRQRGSSSNDYGAELRAWADGYAPARGRGQAPLYSHVDAALAYVAERANGRTHYKAMMVLQSIFGARQNALERAVWPLIPDACAHLEVPVRTALWRDTPPPKSK